MDNLRVAKVDNVVLEHFVPPTGPNTTPTRSRQRGTLHLTPHHLIFSPPSPPQPVASSSTASSSSDATPTGAEIWISYPSITLLTRLPQAISGLYPLQVRTRTFDSYVLFFERDREGGAEDVWQSVKDCAVASSVEQLYAFFYQLPPAQTSRPEQRSSPSQVKDTPRNVSSPLSLSNPQPPSPTHPASSASNSAPSSSSSLQNGWSTFNPRTEFARQGLGSRTKAWRFSDINRDYSFSPTYPNKLVVPSRISDSTLAQAGKYRSKGRIPALTYLHWANYASITRSSQPMVGLKQARSASDERLVECIFSSHQSPDTAYASTANPLAPPPLNPSASPPHVYGATTTNLIVDARPTTNAMANAAMGAGTENMENYRTGKKAYLGIDNIHVMRNSLKTVAEAIRETESGPSGWLDRTLLRRSNWLKHISTLLDGSLVVVRNIHLNASHVLIHCSDGWDRTSQLSAIAQVCLDPFYRTIEGFKVLVEKDWLAFGHKFLDRSGHLSSEKLFTVMDAPDEDSEDEGGGGGGAGASKAAQAFLAWGQKQFSSNHHLKETSPVFHQFLDCVWQVQRQFPTRFEYNEDYLLDLYLHLYSCQFGTFLFNSESQRREPPNGSSSTASAYVDRTISAWDWLDRPEQRQRYLNSGYDPSIDARDSRKPDADQGVLMYDPRDVRFWYRLFRRGDEEMNGNKVALAAQATGADMMTVSPGQVDPVSPEGLMENVVAKVRGEEGLGVSSPARSRVPSPAPASAQATQSDAWTHVRSDPPGKEGDDTPANHVHSVQPVASETRTGHPATDRGGLSSNSSKGPALRGGGNRATPAAVAGGSGAGGWGRWGKLSSTALSALSGAAKEIRSIGFEAMNQIRAEAAEVDGEMWTGGSGAPGTGIGEGRVASGAGNANGEVSSTVRAPLVAKPWDPDGPRKDVGRTINGEVNGNPTATSRIGAGGAMPSASLPRLVAKREPSWNANPWGDQVQADSALSQANADATSANAVPVALSGSAGSSANASGPGAALSSSSRSLADLTLLDRPRSATALSGTTQSGGAEAGFAGHARRSAESEEERRTTEAALGGDRKAWDPLGAL